MGPRGFDPYKYKRRRGQVEAVEAGADDDAGEIDEEDSEDEEEVLRVQEAITASRLDTDGYQPRAQLFPTMEEAAASAPSQEDMVGGGGIIRRGKHFG